MPRTLLTSAYDAAGRRTGLTATNPANSANDDFVNVYAYDAAGRTTQVTQTGQGGRSVADKRVDLEYDALGRRTAVDRYADLAGTALVATSLYAYDAAGRQTALYHRQGTNTLADYGWGYDAAGRLIRETTADGTTSYKYDAAGQLTAAVYADPGRVDETYAYDATGNRTSGSHQTGTGNRLAEDADYTYQYDDEGNQTRETKKADGSYRTFQWDHRNRLIEVEQRTSANALVWTVEYDYDAYNRLIRRQADTNGDGAFDEAQTFVYDGTQAVLVFDDAGSVTNRMLWGPAVDELFADENALNEVLWSLTDRLGTVRDVAEYDTSTGTTSVVNHLEYDAFGNVVSQTNSATIPLFRFTGRYTDPLTGDQWNWHRWYNARTGRWRSQDPSGLGPDQNPYRYVGNAATNYVDPSGLQAKAGFFIRAWNNIARPWIGGLGNSIKNAPESLWNMSTPGQAINLWQGDHPTQQFCSRVKDEGLINAAKGAAGDNYGPLLRATSPYQIFVGTPTRFRGLIPRNAQDEQAARDLQYETASTTGGFALSFGGSWGMLRYCRMRSIPRWMIDDFPGIGTAVSQKQLRHVLRRPEYRGGGYFDNAADAQAVLDAFHAGDATIIGATHQGFPVVRYGGVTGTNVNVGAGFQNQPTNVFIIKGTASPSVVPANPAL